MRVHRLEVTAFGPFPGTEVIDFDPLNRAGIFLLTGQTGAGKTSILDAICFGLYGSVPGVRDRAKSYRSHHAAPDRAPRVVLEVTLRGRRLRITRCPPWSRPSRRARSGAVDQKARAWVEEMVDGEWAVRSSRADEVGHLITGLLGLNRDQFCQVVLLAQGEFQTFLRAGGTDRQRILETLFGTQRFQAVERWLVEHRREQSRRCQAQVDALDVVAARLQEVCSPVTAGEDFSLPLTGSGNCAALLLHARELAAVGAQAVEDAASRLDEETTASKHAQHAYDEARSVADLRRRHGDARRRHDELVAAADMVALRERRLVLARSAEAMLPLVRLSDEADEELVVASAVLADARSRCPALGPQDELSPFIAALRDRVSSLGELSFVEQECVTFTCDLEATAHQREDLALRHAAAHADLEALPGRRAELREQLEAASRLIGLGAEAAAGRHEALQALDAAVQAARLDAVTLELGVNRSAAHQAVLQTTQVWLDAKERLLAGVAAELAGRLLDGEGCPVCGSTAHPAPAAPTAEHVSAELESALYARVAAARESLAEMDARLDQSRAARERARIDSHGRAEDDARALVDDLETVVAAAATAERAQPALAAKLAELDRAAGAQRSSLHELLEQQARLSERSSGLQQRLLEGRARIAAAISSDATVAAVLEATRRELRLAEALQKAVASQQHALRAAETARSRMDAALAESDFASGRDVLAAALGAAEAATLESLNRSHAAELEACSRELRDPVLEAAAACPAPDLEALEAAATAARAASAQATSIASATVRRQQRHDQLVDELAAAAEALQPLRLAKELADGVAGLCSGSSPDNATRTALSHYVLASRLSQVVAAANSRLDAICGGRYQLGHTLTRSAGDSRGGLGLVVHDSHTDRERDPGTLSGGETFYVSLSLALGLADVVTGEAGGAELSTLFVDEGFGGLDDETREEVLDELDALRSGGRTIGLVSHLTELRSRIPTQLHIVAGAHGSTCRPVSGADIG